MSEKLNLNFTFSFEATIWNMLTDASGHKLLLEVRDHEKHEVSFAAIDLQAKALMWEGLTFEEGWWVGMTSLADNVLLLHQFEDSQNPENRQLFALDVNSREVLWAVTDFTFLNILEEQVIGFSRQGEERHYSTIGLRSGEIAQAGSLTAELLQANAQQAQKPVAGEYPLHYPESNEFFEAFGKLVDKKFGQQAIKACDYMERDNRLLISYYVEQEEGLTNFLAVFDGQGEVLLHELLDDQLSAVAMDTFFVINDQLIFICRKKEIKSYAL